MENRLNIWPTIVYLLLTVLSVFPGLGPALWMMLMSKLNQDPMRGIFIFPLFMFYLLPLIAISIIVSIVLLARHRVGVAQRLSGFTLLGIWVFYALTILPL